MKGFTLLELLIVIMIIGILATFALPSYKSYVDRARFTEVILATMPYKTAVTLALSEGENKTALHNGYADIPENFTNKSIASIIVKQGIITATASSTLDHNTYILTPNNNGNAWTVSGSCIKAHLCKGES